jgi:dolichol-phosphate mannosyltransferase
VSRLRPRGFKILLEILARHDLRVQEIPFTFGERIAGVSKASFRNGVHLVYQMAGLRMGRLSRFAAVGLLGSLVNLAVMAVLVHGLFDLSYVVASVVAAEVSILHNYLLHERFVFRDRGDQRRRWPVRLGQQLLFNNIEAVIRLPLLILLVEALTLNSVLAQAATLALSFSARFLFATRVVYPVRAARLTPRNPPSVSGAPTDLSPSEV